MSDFNLDFDNLPALMPEKTNGIHQSQDNNEILAETISDPNSIIVQVTGDTPLAVLWGPPTCCKSVAKFFLHFQWLLTMYPTRTSFFLP